jgi:hypothetical protein
MVREGTRWWRRNCGEFKRLYLHQSTLVRNNLANSPPPSQPSDIRIIGRPTLLYLRIMQQESILNYILIYVIHNLTSDFANENTTSPSKAPRLGNPVGQREGMGYKSGKKAALTH